MQYENLEIYREIQSGFATGANEEHVLGAQEFALRTFHETVDRQLLGSGSGAGAESA